MEQRQRSRRRRAWPWTSFAVGGIVLLAAAPAGALLFALSHAWCRDHGWPTATAAPIALACLTLLGWWWCGVRRQREWIAATARPLPREEWPRLLPALAEVQDRLAFRRELEVWLAPRRETNAWAIGARQLVVTAGLVAEPPARQGSVLAHELAHFKLGHAFVCWMLERCVFGYEQLVTGAVVQGRDSRFMPASLLNALVIAFGFTLMGTPLLVLRLAGAALARQMEWEADGLAARHGYAEPLEVVFSAFPRAADEPVEIGFLALRTRFRTHPLTVRRRGALRTGRVPRARALAWLRGTLGSAARALARTARSEARLALAPPIDCVTIFMSWCLADLAVLQTMIGGAFVGVPFLLPLAMVALRGEPRRPIKRLPTLRLGLLLMFAAHAVFVVDPAVQHEDASAGLLDVVWLVGATAIALGVGVRAWLKAIARGAGLILLPGRYAQRLLSPPVASPPSTAGAEPAEPP